MEQETVPSIFGEFEGPAAVRRKFMVPKWIRVFAWIVAVYCPLQLLSTLVVTILIATGSLSQYFPQNNAPIFTLMGAVSLGATILKGTAAIGLLKEKDWAVRLCIADGAVSIALRIYSLVMHSWVTVSTNGAYTGYYFSIELLLVIPYLVNMIRIRKDWEENRYAPQQGVR